VQISAADGTPFPQKLRRGPSGVGESVLPVAFWASPSAGKDRICSRSANLPFVFDFSNARLAITVSVMNFTFALLPAARVVNVSPIAAPKYE
jgi:hypothetical protein